MTFPMHFCCPTKYCTGEGATIKEPGDWESPLLHMDVPSSQGRLLSIKNKQLIPFTLILCLPSNLLDYDLVPYVDFQPRVKEPG